jgi:hypothetical protein
VKKFTIPTGRTKKSAYSIFWDPAVAPISAHSALTITSPPPIEGEFILDLISACLIALISVFTLLTLLAVIMDLITRVFPAREGQVDPVIVAAISSTVASVIPGARVVRIEEER